MVELFEQNIRRNERQSSKGNQLKWENEGIGYKADFTEKDVQGLLENAVGYSEDIKERVRKIICRQMRKYQYLFVH